MIYFIEVDETGALLHCTQDPSATMVPLDNRISFLDASNQPTKDTAGNLLTSAGKKILSPIEIDQPTFATLMAEGMGKYTYDTSTHTVVAIPVGG